MTKTELAKGSLVVLGGMIAPAAFEPLLPAAMSQVGLWIRRTASIAIPGLLASAVLTEKTANLVWVGIAVNGLGSMLGMGASVPGGGFAGVKRRRRKE